MRTISDRVDIVWSSGSKVLKTINSTTPIMMDNSLVYTDSYIISPVSTTDDGREIQCELVINISPPVIFTDSVTLDVNGMLTLSIVVIYFYLLFCTQYLFLQ